MFSQYLFLLNHKVRLIKAAATEASFYETDFMMKYEGEVLRYNSNTFLVSM